MINTYGEEKTSFKNNIWDIAACLFLPEDFNESKKYPALVFAHPGGGVMEQTSSIYAKDMLRRGYVTLVFDASHQGKSEGISCQCRMCKQP